MLFFCSLLVVAGWLVGALLCALLSAERSSNDLTHAASRAPQTQQREKREAALEKVEKSLCPENLRHIWFRDRGTHTHTHTHCFRFFSVPVSVGFRFFAFFFTIIISSLLPDGAFQWLGKYVCLPCPVGVCAGNGGFFLLLLVLCSWPFGRRYLTLHPPSDHQSGGGTQTSRRCVSLPPCAIAVG